MRLCRLPRFVRASSRNVAFYIMTLFTIAEVKIDKTDKTDPTRHAAAFMTTCHSSRLACA